MSRNVGNMYTRKIEMRNLNMVVNGRVFLKDYVMIKNVKHNGNHIYITILDM